MSEKISTTKVAWEGPFDAPILFIGDFPSTHDDVAALPLRGSAGALFDMALQGAGLGRDQVRVGNVLNYQPMQNDYDRAQGTWQLEESQRELMSYLGNHKHKLIVAMGDVALEFFTSHRSIEKHRGSVYQYEGTLVLPTIHPRHVLSDGTNTVAFLHDLEKAIRISEHGWTPPQFNFIIDPEAGRMKDLLPTLLAAPRLYTDIECRRGTGELKCIGFAWTEHDAVCIFADTPAWQSVRELLESPIPKTFHNGYFDTMILRHWGYEVTSWDFDTMIAQHTVQPELSLGLDYCTSIYTDINYYKDDGKDSSDRIKREVLGRYNCLDCVATAQVEAGVRAEMDDVSQRMFEYEFSQVPMAQHFAQTGLFVDTDRRVELENVVAKKREADLMIFIGICQLYGVEPFLTTQHQKVKDFLYKTLALPTKTNREGKVTADEDAIVSLLTTCQRELQTRSTEKGKEPWKHKVAALRLILRIRGNDKLLSSYLRTSTSEDGRVRSNYNITGTETGRWSSSSFWDGTGLNGQTIPREEI